MDKTTGPNKPIETLRDGRLKATVWENKNEKGSYHTVSLAKVYEDRNGKLQETNSFSAGELLRIAELARESHGHIRDMRREHAVERSVTPKPEAEASAHESRPPRFRDYADPGQDR
ncbi:MAG: hypothetical protein AAFY02_16205 [Pseudomonadota bacterium]